MTQTECDNIWRRRLADLKLSPETERALIEGLERLHEDVKELAERRRNRPDWIDDIENQ